VAVRTQAKRVVVVAAAAVVVAAVAMLWSTVDSTVPSLRAVVTVEARSVRPGSQEQSWCLSWSRL
jgi:hypothetical protein